MTTFTVTTTINRELYQEVSLEAQTNFKQWQRHLYLVPAIACGCIGLYSLLLAPKGSLIAETQTSFIFLMSAIVLAVRKKLAIYRLGKDFDKNPDIGAPHQYIVNDESITIKGRNHTETYPRKDVTKIVTTEKYMVVITGKRTVHVFPAGQLTKDQEAFILRTFTPTN